MTQLSKLFGKMDTKVSIPSSISGVCVLVRVAQWNDTAGKMFTHYLAPKDSVIQPGSLFRTMCAQSTFSLLVDMLSNLRGATAIRPAFIPLKHCGKSVLVPNVLQYGIPNEISA